MKKLLLAGSLILLLAIFIGGAYLIIEARLPHYEGLAALYPSTTGCFIEAQYAKNLRNAFESLIKKDNNDSEDCIFKSEDNALRDTIENLIDSASTGKMAIGVLNKDNTVSFLLVLEPEPKDQSDVEKAITMLKERINISVKNNGSMEEWTIPENQDSHSKTIYYKKDSGSYYIANDKSLFAKPVETLSANKNFLHAYRAVGVGTGIFSYLDFACIQRKQYEKIPPYIGIDTLKFAAFGVTSEEEGHISGIGQIWFGERAGIFKACFKEPPAHFTIDERLPKNINIVAAFHIKSPDELYREIQNVDEEKGNALKTKVNTAIGAVEQEAGVNIERDILSQIGNDIIIGSVKDGAKFISVEIKDRLAIEGTLDKLSKKLNITKKTDGTETIYSLPPNLCKGEDNMSLIISDETLIIQKGVSDSRNIKDESGKVYDEFSGFDEKANGLIIAEENEENQNKGKMWKLYWKNTSNGIRFEYEGKWPSSIGKVLANAINMPGEKKLESN